MPTYIMVCETCGKTEEMFLWYSQSVPTVCECGEAHPELYHQNWQAYRPVGRVYGEDHIMTFGQQSELNARRLGKEQIEKMNDKYDITPPDEDLPWYRDTNEVLDTKKIKDMERYIVTGEP